MKNTTILSIYQGKLLIIILFLIIVCTSGIAQSNLGDVNADGSIDIIDALLVAQYYVGLNSSLLAIENADVNTDGSIDIIDALLIAQYYVGLITSFPGQPDPTPAPTVPPDATPPAGPPVPGRTAPYGEFILAYGETVQVEVSNVLIKFVDVADSRCPLDVVCVWEGEATITLELWTGSRFLDYAVIKAPPADDTREYVQDPSNNYVYEVECRAVDPYPAEALNPPAPEEYIATLYHGLIMP